MGGSSLHAEYELAQPIDVEARIVAYGSTARLGDAGDVKCVQPAKAREKLQDKT